MKKNLIFGLLFGLALAVTFSSCKKDEEDPTPPASVVANFTISPDADLTAPVEITFTNTSVVPESAGTATYAWDFGDDAGTSTNENPVYTYTDAGNYTITLTVSTPNADDAVKTMDITVASGTIFEMDFEGFSPDATTGAYLPNDWVVLDLDGGIPDDADLYDAGWKIASSSRMGSDVAVATSYYDSPYPDADDWMITPKIAIQANTYLSFDAMSLTSSGDYPDHYEVYVSTTTQDADGCLDATNGKLIHYKYPETWAADITNGDGVDGGGIQSYEIDLSEFAGQEIYIGFRLMTPEAYGSELGIDNIKVFLK